MGRIVNRFTYWVYRAVASNKLSAAVIGLFVLQATWLAFTAIYPMPFDEFAHIGAIQLYAEQWSWVVTEQPLDTGIIGDLTREPSFLYRWLMSFPYRVLDNFLSVDQTIIVLRLMNVGMVAGGIVLFRRLLREWSISKRIINVVLLAFVMTPIVPFLAAHVNYDNLMFLLTPVILLYATRIIRGNEKLMLHVTLLVLASLAAVLAKQTILPAVVVIVICTGISVVWRNRGKRLGGIIKTSLTEALRLRWFYLVLAAIGVLGVMAVERYGVNLTKYGIYWPPCEVVQPVEFCEDFGPWYRNNVTNVQNRPAEQPYGNPLSFTQYWVSRMMRGYFAIFQHVPAAAVSGREPYGPIVTQPLLPLPVGFAVVAAFGGVLAVVWQWRKVWANPYLRLSLLTIIGFTAALWLYNYRDYLQMWKAEAIQARYTFPLLIPVFTLIAWAVNKSIASRQLKAGFVAVFIICYVWGGGVAGWLIRADDTWRWQHPVAQSINNSVQKFLRFTVIH